MLKNIKYLIIAGVTVFSVTSCEDLVQTEPRQSISFEQGTGDITGIRAILISVYDRLQVSSYYGQQMMLAPDVLSDNLRQTSSNSNRYTFFQNNTFGTHINRWQGGSYAAINEVNMVLENIDKVSTTDAEKTQIKGEAYFLRALLYFDLARIYGYEPGKEVNGWKKSVIIRTSSTSAASQADLKTRATNDEVYALITSDLKSAIAALTPNATPYRANKAAAEALLARVSLYAGKYDDAIKYSTDALASTTKTLVSGANYVAAFNSQPHPESVFEINYVQATETLGANESLNSLTNNPVGGWADIVPTSDLLSLYETNDVRKAQFKAAKKASEDVNFTSKYSASVGPFTDNVPVIRISEIYLIRAEAYAEKGILVEALADLNMLRNRANASLVVAATKQDVINAILRERRLELAFEGHRFFDLKRRGLPIYKVGSVEIPYTDPRVLGPIPATEINLNPKLEQNPGY